MGEDGPVERLPAGSPALRAGSVGHGGWWDRSREVAGQLPNLEDLTISGLTVTDRSHLEALDRLRSLAIWFGATRRFTELLRLPHLQRIDIWRVRQVEAADLEPLNQVPRLETLALRELPRVRSLSWLTQPGVRNLELDLKSLASLDSLSGLTRLENLVLRTPVPDDVLTQLTPLPALGAAHLYDVFLSRLGGEQRDGAAALRLHPIDFDGGGLKYRPPGPIPKAP